MCGLVVWVRELTGWKFPSPKIRTLAQKQCGLTLKTRIVEEIGRAKKGTCCFYQVGICLFKKVQVPLLLALIACSIVGTILETLGCSERDMQIILSINLVPPVLLPETLPHLNRDGIESSWSVPGIQGRHDNLLIKTFKRSPNLRWSICCKDITSCNSTT